MNINKFTQKSLQAVQNCERIAMDYGNQEIAQEHLLYALLTQDDSLIAKLMEKMGLDKNLIINRVEEAIQKRPKVQGGQQYVGQDLNNALVHGEDEAKAMGDEYVSVEHLFLAMMKYASKDMKALFREVPDIKPDKEHLMIVSPDEGAMHRAVYFSNVLGVDMGMFYKRRDYSTVVNGKNPIVAHEFLGDDVTGKDVIIVDDMISSGESMLDVAKQLKERNAGRVFVCTTFGLFTDGFDKFDEYYEKGYINKVVTTNLTYLPPVLYEKPYFVKADMSKFLALIIDSLNHDVTIGSVMNPTDKIHALLEKHKKGLV